MSKIVEFDNGLKLVLEKISHSRAVAVGVMVCVGSSLEDNNNNGIAHFTEHMLFKGTKKRNAYEIANYVESMGVNINAYTSRDRTMYYTLSSFEYIDECLEVLSDMFFNSVFDEREIGKEKGVITEEINADLDNPSSVCFNNIAEAYYGKKNYGLNILGTIDTVNRFHNKEFFNFLSNYYKANNVVISIAGKIDINQAIDLVSKYFYKNFDAQKIVLPKRIVAPSLESIVEHRNITQANLAIAFPSVKESSDDMTDIMFSNLTTGGMSSRLFQKIREELGLVYDISLNSASYKECGYMVLFLGTSNKLASEALKAVFEELEKIKAAGFTEEEISKSKEQIKLKVMLMQEQAMSVMRINASRVSRYNKYFNIDKELDNINKVTSDDLLSFANKYIDYNLAASSYVGNCKDFDVLDNMR